MSRKGGEPVVLTRELHMRMAAYHESGHVLAAVRAGVRVIGALLNWDGSLGTPGVIDADGVRGEHVKGRTMLFQFESQPAHIRARIQMAGPIAQAVASDRRLIPMGLGFNADLQRHVKNVRGYGANPRIATQEAKALVLREWATVAAIAAALCASGYVDEETIARTMARTETK